MILRYFRLNEFDSPDEPGSGGHMNPDFLTLLDNVRDEAGIPFKVNSGYRTKAHNKQVGGVSGSAHRKGRAADIAANTGATKYRIVRAAILHGVPRIGIAETFIHLDNDTSLPHPSIWLY